jgi:hypothetical protein
VCKEHSLTHMCVVFIDQEAGHVGHAGQDGKPQNLE